MRSAAWLVVGIMVGTYAQSGVAQQRGILGLNHVAIAVPNFDEAARFYTDVMGFPEAFAFRDATGPVLSYFQVSRTTFVELMPVTPQRPAGFVHYGLEVANLDAEVQRLRRGGLQVTDPAISPRTKARGANFTTPQGTRVEMFEYGPESLQRKAIDRWKP
jgi:catechol 2,3-dioxygenase-like lactoylglutathione lyase family enzyme